jgi:hypothetical protein
VEAGLIQVSNLDSNDLAVIEQLTDDEVTVLIQVAVRLYPEVRGIVKLGDLQQGELRLCVPL